MGPRSDRQDLRRRAGWRTVPVFGALISTSQPFEQTTREPISQYHEGPRPTAQRSGGRRDRTPQHTSRGHRPLAARNPKPAPRLIPAKPAPRLIPAHVPHAPHPLPGSIPVPASIGSKLTRRRTAESVVRVRTRVTYGTIDFLDSRECRASACGQSKSTWVRTAEINLGEDCWAYLMCFAVGISV
jgi:hypothetical protein